MTLRKLPDNIVNQIAAGDPFGKGAHACIGAGLAEIQLAINLALILQNFKISTRQSLDKVKIVNNPSPALSENFKVVFTRRS